MQLIYNLLIFCGIATLQYISVTCVKTLPPKQRINDPKVISPVKVKPSSAELLDYNDQSQLAKCSDKWARKFSHIKRRFSDSQLQTHCKMSAKWVQQGKTMKKPFKISRVQADWIGNVWNVTESVSMCRRINYCNKFLRQVNGNLDRKLKQDKQGLSQSDKALREFMQTRTGANTIVKISKPLLLSRKKRQTISDLADIIQQKIGKAQRKEIRMLSVNERNTFFSGVAKLKKEMVGDRSKYDLLTFYHTPEQSPEAHFCAAFLPFHRELLKNLEVALRENEASAALPYWDPTLDQPLPDPKDSVLWTEELFGNGQGDVTTGPFAEFSTMPDDVIVPLSPSKKIVRGVGVSPFGSLMKDSDIQLILNKTTFRDLTYCVDPYLELVHGAGHMWVGGHMIELRTSPNDPVFFMYHAFIDAVWEQWRQMKQEKAQRETDYPKDEDSCNDVCTAHSNMKPFQLQNLDGLSNRYADTLYTYDPRPTCSSSSPDCLSPYLFCDTTKYKCVSKVKANGNCSGFESQDICYKSKCQQGKCVQGDASFTIPPPTFGPTTTAKATTVGKEVPIPIGVETTTFVATLPPTVPVTIPPVQPTQAPGELLKTVWIPITVIKMIGQNAQPTYPDANIISTDVVHNIKFSGVISDASKVPFYTGAAFAQVLNPFTVTDAVEASLDVYDENDKKCSGFCHNSQTGIYESCDPKVTLSSNVLSGTDVAYTRDFEQARVINWNGNKRRLDKYMFLCYFPAGSPVEPNIVIVTQAPSISTATQTSIVIDGGKGTNIDIKSVTDNATSNVVNGGCTNMHRCCMIWSGVGECKRNPWMQKYCQKDCGVCQAGAEVAPESCADFDVGCPSWKTRNQCTRNPNWMEENCRSTCNVCTRGISEMMVTCGASGGAARCADTNDKCRIWAANNECENNPWWMKENCAVSCNSCKNAASKKFLF